MTDHLEKFNLVADDPYCSAIVQCIYCGDTAEGWDRNLLEYVNWANSHRDCDPRAVEYMRRLKGTTEE